MGNLNFDDFIDKITYCDINSQKEKSELRHWLEMIGTYKYERYFEVLRRESRAVSFEDLKFCATYDFNLSRILFAMLKHCENYLRATVTYGIDDFELNETDYQHKILKKIGSKKRKKLKKIKWPNILEEKATFYQYIDASGFYVIIRYYLLLPNDRFLFKRKELCKNLMSINRFRNSVYHHHCIINDNDLKTKIINLFRYIPSPGIRDKYIGYINKETKKVGNKYNYPILFTQEEKKRIMSYQGCNYGY